MTATLPGMWLQLTDYLCCTANPAFLLLYTKALTQNYCIVCAAKGCTSCGHTGYAAPPSARPPPVSDAR